MANLARVMSVHGCHDAAYQQLMIASAMHKPVWGAKTSGGIPRATMHPNLEVLNIFSLLLSLE